MQLVDNPVTRVRRGRRACQTLSRLFTYLHPYTVVCYSYYRMLMRICVLKTYPLRGVTSSDLPKILKTPRPVLSPFASPNLRICITVGATYRIRMQRGEYPLRVGGFGSPSEEACYRVIHTLHVYSGHCMCPTAGR